MSLQQYLQGVKSEMQRVTWPSKAELRGMSLACIGVLTTAGIALWLLDSAVVTALCEFAKLHI